MGGRQGPRFTAAEDEALRAVVQGMTRVKWKEVNKSLVALGYINRTKSSLRSRYLRSVQANNDEDPGKNRCRLCGKFQRGHVCTATMTPPPLPPPPAPEETPAATDATDA